MAILERSAAPSLIVPGACPERFSEGIYSVDLNPNLSFWERDDARNIIRWLKGKKPFLGAAGHMVVSGPPRQGKGTFANFLAWKLHRYFLKPVVRDDHPTEFFGPYTFFNEEVLLSDIEKMEEVAALGVNVRKARTAKQIAVRDAAVSHWRTEKGEVMLQNSVALLDEYHRYVDRRRPAASMLLWISGIIKMYGHLDVLVIGMAQEIHDLDRYRILPYVTHHVKVQMCDEDEGKTLTTVKAHLHRVTWNRSQQKFVDNDKPTLIYLDGMQQCPEIGVYALPGRTSDGLEEGLRPLVDFIRQEDRRLGKGHVNQDSLSLAFNVDVNRMREVLQYLIRIRYLGGLTWFSIFQSKSAPALGMLTSRRPSRQ